MKYVECAPSPISLKRDRAQGSCVICVGFVKRSNRASGSSVVTLSTRKKALAYDVGKHTLTQNKRCCPSKLDRDVVTDTAHKK